MSGSWLTSFGDGLDGCCDPHPRLVVVRCRDRPRRRGAHRPGHGGHAPRVPSLEGAKLGAVARAGPRRGHRARRRFRVRSPESRANANVEPWCVGRRRRPPPSYRRARRARRGITKTPPSHASETGESRGTSETKSLIVTPGCSTGAASGNVEDRVDRPEDDTWEEQTTMVHEVPVPASMRPRIQKAVRPRAARRSRGPCLPRSGARRDHRRAIAASDDPIGRQRASLASTWRSVAVGPEYGAHRSEQRQRRLPEQRQDALRRATRGGSAPARRRRLRVPRGRLMAIFVKFWARAGSIPRTPGHKTRRRYGGNTSCVEVRVDDTLFHLRRRHRSAGARGGSR